MVEMEEASETKASKVRTKSRTEDMEVVPGQARTELVDHTARIAQLEGDLHELKGKLDFSERCNNVTDS